MSSYLAQIPMMVVTYDCGCWEESRTYGGSILDLAQSREERIRSCPHHEDDGVESIKIKYVAQSEELHQESEHFCPEDSAIEDGHVFLVAIEVVGADRKTAELWLHDQLPRTESKLHNPKVHPIRVESWWIAEDERHDGSDNDSAIFVPSRLGISQNEANYRFEGSGMTRCDCQ